MASYSNDFKKKVVKEYKTTDKTISEVATEFDVNNSSVSNWKSDKRYQVDEDEEIEETTEVDEPEEPEETTEVDEPTEEPEETTESETENAGVIVDQVEPQETDTRKNKETEEPEEPESEWKEIDFNDGSQVKTVMETTDMSTPRKAQKLLKAFKTGDIEDIPQFDEIRLSDGELR